MSLRNLIILIGILFVLEGCENKSKKNYTNSLPISLKIYDIPEGSDPAVSAEMGGKNFIGEGWDTKENYHFLGSENAVKEGAITLSLHEFPVTTRSMGKDYNNEFNHLCGNLLYETLLNLDPVNSQYIPYLATHWQILQDKKTFRFRINPNARWSDGMPVTSDDFIATWKLMTDPEILDPYSNEFARSFETPVSESKYIFRIKSKIDGWKQFYLLATYFKILPAHYIKDLSGKEFLEKYSVTYLPGSGPYAFLSKDVIPGQYITLRRRSDYWAENEKFSTGKFNFNAIKFTVIPDETLQYEKFRNKEIDLMEIKRASLWEEKFNFNDVERGVVLRRRVFNKCPNGFQGICINKRKKPFDDIRIRKAFTYAFNRQKFNEKFFYNSYYLVNSYYPGTEYENKSNPQYGFNLDSSILLLSRAGWTEKNSDGYLIKNGNIFEVELPFSKGMDRYLTIYQEDLKKIGIKINLKEIDLNTAGRLGDERSFNLLPIAWLNLDVPNPESSFKSDLADEKNNTNWSGVKNYRIDNLCEEYSLEQDFSKRVKIIQQIDSILAESVEYILWWYAPYQRFVFQNKFGYPDCIIGKSSGIESVLSLWYCHPARIREYENAINDKSIFINSGEIDSKYWENNIE